ncbi:hypothetical protein [Sphingomonas montana]|uniref:hypothetical protein n=1 Tax=Sphingomonas montana TaxID=1843236 RepID=UPI00096F731C|nr:hypothetical protein [Sphingomonas montana]
MTFSHYVTFAVLLGMAGVAAAQPSGATPTGDAVLQSLSRCRTLAAPDARLDCFDKATTALETAVRSKAVTIVDRQDIRNVRRSLFGFTLPRIALFDGADRGDGRSREPAFEELNTTIARVQPGANGRVELRLAEGDAVWSTTDPMPFPPRVGDRIRLRKGAMGNYFLAIAGQRTVRGVRVR